MSRSALSSKDYKVIKISLESILSHKKGITNREGPGAKHPEATLLVALNGGYRQGLAV